MLFGMHVAWRSQADEQRFYERSAAHRDIAQWAMASRMIPAVKLDHLALDTSGRVIRLGGFYACAHGVNVPTDALFPQFIV